MNVILHKKVVEPLQPSGVRKLLTRMGVGLVMIFAFLMILYSHHGIVVAFVLLLQILSFRELIGVRYKEVKVRMSTFAYLLCFSLSLLQ